MPVVSFEVQSDEVVRLGRRGVCGLRIIFAPSRGAMELQYIAAMCWLTRVIYDGAEA